MKLVDGDADWEFRTTFAKCSVLILRISPDWKPLGGCFDRSP
ncbi:hypothetical protein KNP414_06602 [Paenibacillus mucilaginosus KNP414]|uniref:Uncharacterized protein n=1 Tax=Paenibacillus mucilaginosus (strain KNP414) TaxID=1036673 RepID=F8F798_PAEMK|nr:hypothetical protein KNP414_06602 [Paenibacillus mucilaginosus KNP414]